MSRPLPSEAEARAILAQRRTRPAPRPAPKAGKALTGLVKDLDGRFGKGVGALQPQWREIVGERLAKVTLPLKLSRPRAGGGATLELRVPGPAALLIQHQSADILSRVNLFLGPGSVERLRIAQGPLPRVAEVATPRATRSAAPLPAAQEARLTASLSGAPDGLRQALARLGREVLKREPSTADEADETAAR